MRTLDPAGAVSYKYADIDISSFRDNMEMMVEESAIGQPVPIDELVTSWAPANGFDVEKVRAAARLETSRVIRRGREGDE